MKSLLSVLSLLVLTLGCSQDPEVENFKFQISPANPPVIYATFNRVYIRGDEIEEIEVKGPSMVSQFNVVNDNNRTITLVSVEFKVTGPDGKVRTASVLEDATGNALFTGVFRAENDLNCDGFANEDDDTNKDGVIDDKDLAGIPNTTCDLDNQNPSFLGMRYYIFDLLQGVTGEAVDQFRGGTFTFQVRLEGWFGDSVTIEKSFFKIVTFSVTTNS